MKIAVVGATGLVGGTIIQLLEERKFPVEQLIPVASERSVGKEILFNGQHVEVVSHKKALALRPDMALFSAGGGTSLEWAPKYAAAGTIVIDNSSAWRMDPEVPLVVPEVNGKMALSQAKIIANPNCSTIQMVMALAPLHKKYKIKRLVISTYQSVSGTGYKALEQMDGERAGTPVDTVYPHPIDKNCLPHCDVFLDNGYTKEEMKLVHETRKILGDDQIKVTATAVRVPVSGGHSESVNVEFEQDFELNEVKALLQNAPGVILQDDPGNNLYPMPIHAKDKDEVFVGRIRRDESAENALNMWIVADNLRKGAATNAIQIAEYLVNEHKLTAKAQ